MTDRSPNHEPDDDRSEAERTLDDLSPEDLAEDDIALTEDRATRGPFRATLPEAGVEPNFAEGPDGESLDPVYREATAEVDVYEDLPSRRARAEPEPGNDDESQPEPGDA